MAIDLQQVKADFEGNTSICRATWAKVLDTALANIEAQRRLAFACRTAAEALKEAKKLLDLNGIDVNDYCDYGNGRADDIVHRMSVAIDTAEGAA